FIAAGIPLVVSASFKKNQIPGLTYGTGGHLMCLVGFTADGQPVMNDPFSPTNDDVRKTVGRAEFETAWLTTSRGIVYVIHPPSVALPDAPGQANW
ncbi:MAG: peptidase C39 family protein, partial [Dactylosporangium sp.]|nr:peptidase C39 family protein [Dactylosporangium sp.]